jgi:adenylosuccinate lyase
LIEQACRHAQNQKRNLLEVLLENPKVRELLSPEELARLLAPGNFMGSAEQIVKNVLLGYKSSKA